MDLEIPGLVRIAFAGPSDVVTIDVGSCGGLIEIKPSHTARRAQCSGRVSVSVVQERNNAPGRRWTRGNSVVKRKMQEKQHNKQSITKDGKRCVDNIDLGQPGRQKC